MAKEIHAQQRAPELGVDGIRRGADEGFHLQVLLDRLEGKFRCPAVLVDRRTC